MNAEQDFVGTIEPTGQDVLDATKLADWMAANVAGFTGPVTVRKFAGGQSNPTYRLESPSGSYVLRLTVSDSLLSGSANVTITVNPGPAFTLTALGIANPITAGTAGSTTVTLRDAS